jgi:ABC-type transport system substrate-binding protein
MINPRAVSTLIAGVAGLLLIAGCPPRSTGGGARNSASKPNPSQQATANGGVVRLPLEIAPADPALAAMDFSDSRLFALARCLETPLVRSDAKGELLPGLAGSWSTADGGTTWTFTLRALPGHEAEPGYAGTLWEARIKSILSGKPGPLRAQLFDLLAGAQAYAAMTTSPLTGIAVGGDVLTLTLTRPDQLAPLWLSQPGMGVLPLKSGLAQGFGPFYIAARDGNALTLKPNSQALDGKPMLEELHFILEPDRAKQLALFQQGALDAANLNPEDVETVISDTTLAQAVVKQDSAASILGLFNLSHFPWGDSKFQSKLGLRQALNFSLDRDNLESALSAQLTAWPHFLPAAMQDDINPALIEEPTYPLSPQTDAAMAGEKAADHEQGSKLIPGMDLSFLNQSILAQTSEPILEDWKQVSIKMRPFGLSQADLDLRVGNATHEIILKLACPAYAAPDAMFYPLLYSALSGVGGNWGYLKDADVDRRITQAQAATDPVIRQKLYRELSADLEQRALCVFLGYYSPTLLISPKLGGYQLTPYDFDASLPAQDFAKLGLKATAS